MPTDCGCDAPDITPQLTPLDTALAQLLDKASPITATETVGLHDALGRVLAEDQFSSIFVPSANNSAMDGYALRSIDVSGNGHHSLPISQRICAGSTGTALKPGTAARIFTGALVPEGADTVIMQERCEVHDDHVTVPGPVSIGHNIREKGEDIADGDLILQQGILLKPQHLGLAASVGIASLPVYRPLRVALFFTGDELRQPGETRQPGQIYNANQYTLHGLLKTIQCEIINLGTVPDTLQATEKALQEGAEKADLIMTSGGVSVGEEDHIRQALANTGKLDLWRVSIKPGKPMVFGRVAQTPFIGLPGNPVSVFVTFCILARPYIQRTQGILDPQTATLQMPIRFHWPKPGHRREYIRVRIDRDAAGKPTLSMFPNQGSGVLTSAAWADGLAIIPENTTLEAGDIVEYLPFSGLLS